MALSYWERAQAVIPGGVNSPVRSFANVGMDPVFIEKAEGAYIYDTERKCYIDYITSWGALIFGHGYRPVVEAVALQLQSGVSYGLATQLEVDFAEMLVAAVPSLEMVRLVNSGTEATMSALRLARGFTGRSKILKFSGCYHGHSNELLVAAGSGALTFGVPQSAGVTETTAQDTLVCPYNDLNAVAEIFAAYGEDIAAVIVEPVAANMGLVLPQEGFLEGLRHLTRVYGALLIFDEVITGFRLAYGGAQEYYGVIPDLTCLGKIIGGGFPVAAYGGRREIMQYVSPLGPVYQAGTLSGNPVAVTAGIAILKQLQDGEVYRKLSGLGEAFRDGLRQIVSNRGIALQVTGVGSLTGVFFADHEINRFEQIPRVNQEMYQRFFRLLYQEGILFPPSSFETIFISAAHSMADIERTLSAVEKAFKRW
ncbi:MAG TPA: glutamate-1-semialdehyde 2,1-aminomutase [Bacillota bacterium]|nr:glutamate-1-semialdehyde 2,1-aminomutase [Bacillota bacterium]